jgi:hypothetical protein
LASFGSQVESDPQELAQGVSMGEDLLEERARVKYFSLKLVPDLIQENLKSQIGKAFKLAGSS